LDRRINLEYKVEDIAKASFKYFFVKVLGYRWAPHFDEWQALIENNKRFLLECARGHGKTIFLIGYSLWQIYRGHVVDILLMAYSEEQVKNNVMNKFEEIIQKNDYLAHLRPSTKQLWGAQLKTFSNGSQIRGESFGSSVRGAHPDFAFIDDPLKDKGTMTPEEQYNYAMTVIAGMAKRNTIIGYIGTPLDNGDLLEQLENNKAYAFRAYPALNESGQPLFPYLYTQAELEDKEKEVGSFAFSREFLLKRIDPKSAVFADKYRTINEKETYPEQFAVVRTIIDPAASEKDNACDSAIVTAGVSYDNHKWEYQTDLVHSDDPKAVIDMVLKHVRKYKDKCPDYAVVCEAEVFQKWVANDLKQAMLNKNLNVRLIEVVHQGNQGKHQRIEGLQPSWETKAIHLLPESPLISQFRYYRPGIKGVKIDGVDAFSWLRDEDVAVPVVNAKVVDPGVPSEAWE
jgi:hypothetical protein